MKKTLTVLLSIGMIFSGCSTMKPEKQGLRVHCVPENSKVYVNGVRVENNATTKVYRNENAHVLCKSKGYEDYNETVGYHLNTTGTLDLIGLVIIILPGIGLLTKGAFSLDKTEVEYTLYKKD
jgi:hypothetical protein